MKFGSVCSGIEAASVAWHPLGWRASFLSEIDAFPREVLAHHYPSTPLHGDFTTIQAGAYDPIALLVGGTPCQSFSVAGLRAGLADPRGNLMLEYGALAARLRPRWLVWENVPGVLSSNGGRDFGAFLGMLAIIGYGFAYRVLDAQFVRVDGLGRAVPQRRRRVFVVGCLGDWRRAAAVLLERAGLRGDPAPSREAWEDITGTLSARTEGGGGLGTDFDVAGGLVPERERALTTSNQRIDAETETLIVAHSLRADGFDASEDGTGRGTPLVPVAYSIMPMNSGKDYKAREVDVAQPLMTSQVGGNQGGDYILSPLRVMPFDTTQCTSPHDRAQPDWGRECHTLSKGAHAPAIAFDARQSDVIQYGEKTGPLDTNAFTMGMQVRRLTPRECERLQGFPDDYTLILRKGKPAADGPRYKALGNSMAINVMRWVGTRIQMVESIDGQELRRNPQGEARRDGTAESERPGRSASETERVASP